MSGPADPPGASACAAYLAGLTAAAGSASLAAWADLLRRHVCARCCLRLAGAADPALYTSPAPPPQQLLAAVDTGRQAAGGPADTGDAAASLPEGTGGQEAAAAAAAPGDADTALPAAKRRRTEVPDAVINSAAAAQGNGVTCEAGIPANSPSEPEPAAQLAATAGDGAVQLQDAAPPAGQAVSAAESQRQEEPEPGAPAQEGQAPPCPLCLGVLQSLDVPGGVRPPGGRLLLPDGDWKGGRWQALPCSQPQAIAQAVRAAGHETDDLAVEVAVPASTTVRQLAAWRHLRAAFPDLAHCRAATPGQAAVVSLQDALHWAVVAPLGALLGKRVDAQAQVRLALTWLHPPSAPESDFLFGPALTLAAQQRAQAAAAAQAASGKKQRWTKKWLKPGRSATDNVARLAAAMLERKEAQFLQYAACPPVPPAGAAHLAVRCRREPLYLGTRYLKLLRGLPQSPWFIDGVRRDDSSVQEEIARVVVEPLQPESYKFITAGREDADVRMLGSGRPVILQLANARAALPGQERLDQLAAALAQAEVGVEVRALRGAAEGDLEAIKEGEQAKQKSYLAICRLDRPLTPADVQLLNATKDLVVQQRTPTRVAHRRADLVRPRTVHDMVCEPAPGHARAFSLRLRTQAGTYIKEFVHGDEGRSQPSLGDLLACRASILQLDVLDVHMDFM